jgi:DNA polymerase-3 subunit gamma/tau
VQALYRKWRPQTFDEVVGQEHVIRTLRNALVSGRVHHAYLFSGPRGTGKTTTARLLAKAVNCLAPEDERPCNQCAICQAINEGRLLDLIEIDAASNTGVDDVRELRERVGFRPNEARYKVYVVDEVHMLSNAAFNALLKTLEEPPEHAIFVLATTEIHKIPATVLSRCQRFDFRRISVSEIAARLELIAQRERIDVDREALTFIARQATGSMRDAESLLDQLASYGDQEIDGASVRTALGVGSNEVVMRLVTALAQGDVAVGLDVINTAINEGADARQLARQIVEYLRALLLLRLGYDELPVQLPKETHPDLERLAGTFSAKNLARAVRLFNQAANEPTTGWHPQLPLEMALVETTRVVGKLPDRSDPVAIAEETPSGPPDVSPSKPESPAPPALDTEETSEDVSVEEPDQTDVDGDAAVSLTPQSLRERWAEVLNKLRPRNLSLEALMRSCEPMDVAGDTIVLGFDHKFHRDKIDEEQNRRAVEDVLEEILGRRYRVRCVLKSQNRASNQSPGAEAAERNASKGERQSVEDPVVRMAIEDMGAEVVRRDE